ncbi:rod-binding protein [Novosphingopyxis sp.]|uniref:rod-binding protein n=1 Tax=Novosphingopyxis sp. TaxID=2709690 RepID=UPI003B597402
MTDSIASTGPVAAASAGDSGKAQKKDDLRAAAEAFEAVFLRQMIRSMRSAGLADDIFGNQATDQFRDMQDAHMADAMAGSTDFGIAELLLKQFEGKS